MNTNIELAIAEAADKIAAGCSFDEVRQMPGVKTLAEQLAAYQLAVVKLLASKTAGANAKAQEAEIERRAFDRATEIAASVGVTVPAKGDASKDANKGGAANLPVNVAPGTSIAERVLAIAGQQAREESDAAEAFRARKAEEARRESAIASVVASYRQKYGIN